jgi:hypothetical protein
MTPKQDGVSSWLQWVIAGLVVIAMAVSGYAINKADNAVQKDDYRIDQTRLEQGIKCLSDKMDRMLERLPVK